MRASLTRHEHTMSQVNVQTKSHKQLTWICAFGAWKFLFFSLPYLNCIRNGCRRRRRFRCHYVEIRHTHSVPCTWFHVNFCSEYRDFFGFCFLKRNFFFQLHQFQIPKSRTEALQWFCFFFIYFSHLKEIWAHCMCQSNDAVGLYSAWLWSTHRRLTESIVRNSTAYSNQKCKNL